jgi:quercetin dioxygenase-like cupin family protein
VKKDGPLSSENVGQKLLSQGYQYLQHEYETGTVLQEHAHAEPRKDALLSGELKVAILGTEVLLKAGDILDVPVGVEHTATVIGDQHVVILEGALTDIHVDHWRPDRDGVLSVDTMARKLASYGFTYMQQVYGPGSQLNDHAHREPTRDAVVSGRLVVKMFGKEAQLGPGDMVEIPIGVQHSVSVPGPEPCVLFESAIVDLNVAHWNPKADGQLTLENIAKKLKSLGYHYAHQVYAPGTVFHEHAHDSYTKDAVVSGRLKVAMQGKEVILEPGDILDIPAGIEHNAVVVGAEPVVVLEAEKGHIHRIHWNESVDGPLSVERMAYKLKIRGYDSTPSVLAPGTVHDEHSHDEPRCDAVVSGVLKVTIFGQEIILNPGDMLEIPLGVEHKTEVIWLAVL